MDRLVYYCLLENGGENMIDWGDVSFCGDFAIVVCVSKM